MRETFCCFFVCLFLLGLALPFCWKYKAVVLCSASHDLSSLSRTAEVASHDRGRSARKSRGYQGTLNRPTCYFHCILLAKQVIRPDKESKLVVLWPIKFKTYGYLYFSFFFLFLFPFLFLEYLYFYVTHSMKPIPTIVF